MCTYLASRLTHIIHCTLRMLWVKSYVCETETSVALKVDLVNIKRARKRPADEPLEKVVSDILDDTANKLRDQARGGHPSRNETLAFLERMWFLYRQIVDVKVNCILLTVRCPTLEALHDLMYAINTHELQQLFSDAYFTEEWKTSHGIETIDVEMTICPLEYTQCERELTISGRAFSIIEH